MRRTDAIGVTRSRRHASTASSNSPACRRVPRSAQQLRHALPLLLRLRRLRRLRRRRLHRSARTAPDRPCPAPPSPGPTSPPGNPPAPSNRPPRSPPILPASARTPAIAAAGPPRAGTPPPPRDPTFFAATPPACRTRAAAGCVYAAGSGSSENHESAINRPVPEAHITSPPHSVSMPSTASATYLPA